MGFVILICNTVSRIRRFVDPLFNDQSLSSFRSRWDQPTVPNVRDGTRSCAHMVKSPRRLEPEPGDEVVVEKCLRGFGTIETPTTLGRTQDPWGHANRTKSRATLVTSSSFKTPRLIALLCLYVGNSDTTWISTALSPESSFWKCWRWPISYLAAPWSSTRSISGSSWGNYAYQWSR